MNGRQLCLQTRQYCSNAAIEIKCYSDISWFLRPFSLCKNDITEMNSWKLCIYKYDNILDQ